MTKHHFKPHGLALLLFLVKAGSAAPAPSKYYVRGARVNTFNGVYEERRVPELHYKKLGGAVYDENYAFLYKGKEHGLYGHHGTWILGIGRTLSTAYAWYRAPAYSDKIVPADQWNAVRDYSREGKKTGDPAPEIKVSTNNCFTPQPILNSISLAFLVLTVINI